MSSANTHKLSVFICLDTGREEMKEYLQNLLNNIQESPSRTREFKSLSLELEVGRNLSKDKTPDLIVGTPSLLVDQIKSANSVVPTLVVLQNEIWDESLRETLMSLQTDVRGVFRYSRLFGNKDPDELANFQAAIKDVVRMRTRPLQREEDLAKEISWKARLDEKSQQHTGFISLFGDTATQSMALKLKFALGDVQSKIDRDEFTKCQDIIRSSKVDTVYSHAKLEGLLKTTPKRIPSILVLGETGVGKTLLAQWVADSLGLKLASVNISAISPGMIDGELFGAVKGSYTDAKEDTPGYFLENMGKVVFLDEVGDMEPLCQVRLLRCMDSGEVKPLGWAKKPFSTRCVLVAATNRPLRQIVREQSNAFRADLLFRFDHVIDIPPLRERKGDIRLLISLMLQSPEVNPVDHNRVTHISLDAIAWLERQDYPENFRGFRTILRQAVTQAKREPSRCLCLRHCVEI